MKFWNLVKEHNFVIQTFFLLLFNHVLKVLPWDCQVNALWQGDRVVKPSLMIILRQKPGFAKCHSHRHCAKQPLQSLVFVFRIAVDWTRFFSHKCSTVINSWWVAVYIPITLVICVAICFFGEALIVAETRRSEGLLDFVGCTYAKKWLNAGLMWKKRLYLGHKRYISPRKVKKCRGLADRSICCINLGSSFNDRR